MSLELLQSLFNMAEVFGTVLGGLSLLAIAICAIIHTVRNKPERVARQFRETFKIKGSSYMIGFIVGMIAGMLLLAAAPASAKEKRVILAKQGNHCWYFDGTEGSCGPRHFYTDKKWWAGEAVIVASTVLDMNSTCRALSRGAVETNMILGDHPSCGQVTAFGMGAATYWTFFHALDWHFFNDPKDETAGLGWHLFGYTAIPVAAAAVHLPAAISNYGVRAPKLDIDHYRHDPDPVRHHDE